MKIAVIKTGGKQYKIKEGDTLKVEKIDGQEGKVVKFSDVLLLADKKGNKVEVGAPLVKGAKVEAEIIEQGKDKKVEVVKYKPKTRYKRTYGHRQPYTKIKIKKIS